MLARSMGFQSFIRLGAEMHRRRLYAIVLVRATLLRLDLLCSVVATTYYTSYWLTAGVDVWQAYLVGDLTTFRAMSWSDTVSRAAWTNGVGGLPWAVSLVASLMGSLITLAVHACCSHATISCILLPIFPFWLGVAAFSTYCGWDAAMDPPAPMLSARYWLTLCACLFVVRAIAWVLTIALWLVRRRLVIHEAELPDDLKALPQEQAAALGKIAKGELLDVQMVGVHRHTSGSVTDGRAGGGQFDDSHGGGGGSLVEASSGADEEREFVAFSLRLRTLQWGWQNSLGVDQMVSVAIEGPGINLRREAEPLDASQTDVETGNAARRSKVQTGRLSMRTRRQGSSGIVSIQRGHKLRKQRDASLHIAEVSIGDGATKAAQDTTTTSTEGDDPDELVQRNRLVLTFRAANGALLKVRFGARSDASLVHWHDGIQTILGAHFRSRCFTDAAHACWLRRAIDAAGKDGLGEIRPPHVESLFTALHYKPSADSLRDVVAQATTEPLRFPQVEALWPTFSQGVHAAGAAVQDVRVQQRADDAARVVRLCRNEQGASTDAELRDARQMFWDAIEQRRGSPDAFPTYARMMAAAGRDGRSVVVMETVAEESASAGEGDEEDGEDGLTPLMFQLLLLSEATPPRAQ